MAELVTLDSLFGADPTAVDNSPADSGASGATSPQVSSDPPAESLSPKIQELERLVNRHREQLSGSQNEVSRLRAELEALKTQRSPAAPEPSRSPPSAKIKLAEATQKLLLDNDASLLEAYEEQVLAQRGVSSTDIQKVVADLEAKQQHQTAAQDARLKLQQTLVARHPELGNIGQHPDFIQATAARYQQLAQDTTAALLWPDDALYKFQEPTTGYEYDMRILLQAANEVKAATRATAPPPPSLGLNGGAGTPPANANAPLVPRAMVTGENAVFAHPDVQRALAAIGWGNTTRQQLSKMLEHTDQAVKGRWARGEL